MSTFLWSKLNLTCIESSIMFARISSICWCTVMALWKEKDIDFYNCLFLLQLCKICALIHLPLRYLKKKFLIKQKITSLLCRQLMWFACSHITRKPLQPICSIALSSVYASRLVTHILPTFAYLLLHLYCEHFLSSLPHFGWEAICKCQLVPQGVGVDSSKLAWKNIHIRKNFINLIP